MLKASTDSLTKVFNRDYTVNQISKYLREDKRESLHTMFVIDVDNFKEVNNYYGHTEGDVVLSHIGEVLQKEFRSTDVIGRIGGDEFLVFLKDVTSRAFVVEKAKSICQKVKASLDQVSVSIGISCIQGKEASFEQLYRNADIALYQAKEQGRNTFVSYEELSEETKKEAQCKRIHVKELEPTLQKKGYQVNEQEIKKTIATSFEYCYVVQLSEDKATPIFDEYEKEEHATFQTYRQIYEHFLEEIYEVEEKAEFKKLYAKETLVNRFLEGEKQVSGYFKVFDKNEKFHWYFIELLFHDIDIKYGIHATFLVKDVQEGRNDQMRKYETRTKRRYIRQLENQMSIDSLTGVYNPNKFYEEAKNILYRDLEHDYAMISFDIDRFRIINDLHGEEVGDRVICKIADVLKNMPIENKIYGRYYADCFSIMISYENQQDIIKVIDHIQKECKESTIQDLTFKMSFGIYIIIDRSTPIRLMCDWARLAGRNVKGLTMQYYAFYNEQYRNELMEMQKIEAQMHQALKNKEFQMYLQPKHNLCSNEVVGAEALVRWYHPTEGVIPPNKFIPLFEKNGFILQLDEFIWEEACKVIKEWIELGINLPISVNISRLHTYDPGLVYKLKTLVERYEIPVKNLELEFTEGLFLENVETLYALMSNLKEQGFVLHMDDFGSGYSSLNMLKDVPIDVIKLDKAFFEDISVNERGKIIIENSIRMIHALDLKVMAEGIESKEHVEFLNQSECVVGQGYYYAKPMPISEFNERYIKGR